jgi:hypothetical protein
MCQQAIVNQAAFDIGQMTEQKHQTEVKFQACEDTPIFYKIRKWGIMRMKKNNLNRFGDCVTSSRSLCRRTDGIFEASNRTTPAP